MKTEEKFEVKVTEKTDWKGNTYYYLYVNGLYQELSRDLAVIEKAKQTALDVYTSGRHIEKVLEVINETNLEQTI